MKKKPQTKLQKFKNRNWQITENYEVETDPTQENTKEEKGKTVWELMTK